MGSITVKTLHENKEMINQEMNKVISARNGPDPTFVTVHGGKGMQKCFSENPHKLVPCKQIY